MAKRKVVKAYPTKLHMELYAPGMSVLHRAGLGGLACTLRALENDYRTGQIGDEVLPAPFHDETAPWTITSRTVTLEFGKPENARTYLERLFKYAFDIRNGVLYLPGQYVDDPSFPIRAELQQGIFLTFLQHGRTRKVDKKVHSSHYDPENEGVRGVAVTYRECQSYKHQSVWEEMVDSRGRLKETAISFEGPISPGAVVRHDAFKMTAAMDPPERLLPLLFSFVGTLSLPINRGSGVLIVPDVMDLVEFMTVRPGLTPTKSKECQVAGGADGGFQMLVRARKRDSPIDQEHVRLRAARAVRWPGIAGCYVMTFRSTSWASQQKSRVATVYVRGDDDKALNRFERALALLPMRIRKPEGAEGKPVGENEGKRKRGPSRKSEDGPREEYRVDSVVRPFIAENLARGRPWYAGFVKLMTRDNPANKKPYRNQIRFERKGLHDMISDLTMWDHPGELRVVEAVHEAMRQSMGRIKDETDGANAPLSAATKNRWERFREKLRLDLAGAKTEAQVRFVLMDLFSRGGHNVVLRQHWQEVLPVIRRDWQLARDLGLLALASYVGRGERESVGQDEGQESVEETEE